MTRCLLHGLMLLCLCSCAQGPLFSYTVQGSPNGPSRLFQMSPVLWEGQRAGSPTSLKMNIHAYYLSTTSNCSGPTPLIDYGTDPLIKDLYTQPTLFSGNPEGGSYKCVILLIADTLKFRADATAAVGSCATTATEHTQDIYLSTDSAAGTWKNLEGLVIPATGVAGAPGSEMITLFASTEPEQVVAFRGIPLSQTIPLAAAVQVPGESTLYADYNNVVTSSGGHCFFSGGVGIGIR